MKKKVKSEEEKTIVIKSRAEEKSEELLETVHATVKEMESGFFPTLLKEKEIKDVSPTVDAMRESFRRTKRNIIKSYEALFEVSDELAGRWHDLKSHMSFGLVNARIDEEEKGREHFSRGINGYKILWIFYIGSFAGVILEMLWCYLQKGHIESRQGLIYGPFNVLYGLGAVALSYFLYRFRNHRDWVSFLGGFLVGSILEYICSWGQEVTLGVRAWDYSRFPLNINGRICFYYSLMWGLLGVLWIKRIYPLLSIVILKLPNKLGKILTWLFLVFFIINIIVSGFVMARWTLRTEGKEATSPIAQYIDEHYPDERMQKIFPNWVFSEKK